MSLFDAYERVCLDMLFGTGSPATYQLGLSTSAPTEGGSLNEVVGAGYSRVTLNNNNTTFPAASTVLGVTHKKNGIGITFPMASASWGTVTHWFIYDTALGLPLLWGALSGSIAVGANDIVRFSSGDLDIMLD